MDPANASWNEQALAGSGNVPHVEGMRSWIALSFAAFIAASTGTAGAAPRGHAALDASRAAGLTGHITDDAHRPVPGVQVRLIPVDGDASDARSAVSDTAGAFSWTGLSAGNYRITTRKVGFAPVDVPFTLADGASRTVAIQLRRIARLDTVITKGRSVTPSRYGPASRMDEFYESMQRGMGKFFTREKIDSMPASAAEDIIRGTPGVTVRRITTDTGTYVVVGAMGCHGASGAESVSGTASWAGVVLVVDGIEIPEPDRGSVFEHLHKPDIESIAVYRDLSELPAEVARAGVCAAVYVWTRFGADSTGQSR